MMLVLVIVEIFSVILQRIFCDNTKFAYEFFDKKQACIG